MIYEKVDRPVTYHVGQLPAKQKQTINVANCHHCTASVRVLIDASPGNSDHLIAIDNKSSNQMVCF